MKGTSIFRKSIAKIEIDKKHSQKQKLSTRFTQKLGVKENQEEVSFLEDLKYEALKLKQEPQGSSSFLRRPESYSQILEIPCYEPTIDEFNEPFLLIQNLSKQGFEKYGCVKIKAPLNWGSNFSFNPQKKLTIRRQILKCLYEGKSFQQIKNAYTLEEFKYIADQFEQNFIHKAPFKFDNAYRANEYEYWGMVEDPKLQGDTAVEYAADLPSTKYGSGFPVNYGARMTDKLDSTDEKTHAFNFNNISRAKDSLFQIVTKKDDTISGISSPWMYSGMMFASFCWHVEDLYMYSLNYMHQGAAKTWYCVPSEYKDKFDAYIKEKFGALFYEKPNLLHNIVLALNPLELLQRNIPVYRTEQQPGEFIILFPNVYHSGFSHGFNVSEAINIAVPDWLPHAKKAIMDYANNGFFKKITFPYEWLLFENLHRLEGLNFSEKAKNQLIEEYQLMKQTELDQRKTILACFPKALVRQFDNPYQRYDSHICDTCENYTYLSFISCMACKRKGCMSHALACHCLSSKKVLNIRFTDEELEEPLERVRSLDQTHQSVKIEEC